MDNVTDVPNMHSSQRQLGFSGDLKVKLLDPKIMTGDELSALWRKVATQEYAFDDNTRGNPQVFVVNLMTPASYCFLVNDSALVLIRNVYPTSDANIHFILWDRNFSFRNIIEAGRQIVEWLFKEKSINRVSGYIPKFNHLAARFAATMGFKYEGTLRKAILFNKEYHDVDIYGLLEKEFERRWQQ